jgi:hypothetical protein
MPKNPVTAPITDQEIAFAHLILSGTMNDSQAAEAAGINPRTAAYTKAKPRVRAYMDAHRTAVQEKLIEEEVEGLRNLNVGRDQILARLWQLANLPPEATKGSIAGQIKALTMIVAIENLIPDRRPSPPSQPASPPMKAELQVSEVAQRHRAEAIDRPEPVTATAAESPGNRLRKPEPPPSRSQTAPGNPFVHPEPDRVPAARDLAYDAAVNSIHSLDLLIPSVRSSFAGMR